MINKNKEELVMSEWKEFSAKTVEEALNIALVELETTRENVEYEAYIRRYCNRIFEQDF